MKKLKNIISLFVILAFLSACEAQDAFVQDIPENSVALRMKTGEMAQNENTDSDSQIHQVKGFRFEEGVLQETFNYMTPNEDGVYHLQPLQMRGTVFFLTNSESILEGQEVQIGKTRQEDFLRMEACIQAMLDGGLSMTGGVDLSPSMPAVAQVSLYRSVARLDVECLLEGVQIHSITVKDIVSTGFIYPQAENDVPTSVQPEELTEVFEQPLENVRQTWQYVCEQGAVKHDVEMMVQVNGNWRKLRTELPSLKRNTIYTLKVYGDGAALSVKVLAEEGWEEGTSSGSDLQRRGLVDEVHSEFSEGVRISTTRDTVFVPYWQSNIHLALLGDENTEVTINGWVDGVTVVSAPLTKALNGVAAFDISTKLKMPKEEKKNDYIYLDVHQGNVYTGRVVLAFEPNPSELSGKIIFDENGLCDFGTYIDGELGILKVHEGQTVELEFDGNEDKWMKLEQYGTTYRILGGWKPNDPKADGRTQEARLVVTNANNQNVKEVYIVKRVNWGLPVVEINGTWWCKYNLRGNVKSFSDQINLKNEPHPGGDLFEILQSCDENTLLSYMGDQYQGGNQQGLPLSVENDKFFYEGIKNTALNFGNIDSTLMAPAGYHIPNYDDFAFFTRNNNDNLGGAGTHSYTNRKGQKITLKIVERDVTFLGKHMGIVDFYDFEVDGNHWVLYGLGHQWDTTPGNISRMSIILATSRINGGSWLMEGYASTEKRNENWFKFTGQNERKTRTIRCVKTPVEYMY